MWNSFVSSLDTIAADLVSAVPDLGSARSSIALSVAALMVVVATSIWPSIAQAQLGALRSRSGPR